MKLGLVPVSVAVGILLAGATVQAEMYFYKDANGRTVVVDDPLKIPAGQGGVETRKSEAYPTPRPQPKSAGYTVTPLTQEEPKRNPVYFTELQGKFTRNRRADIVSYEGTARNQSGRKVEYAKIECRFYDKNGSFITNDFTYLNPTDPMNGATCTFTMYIADPRFEAVDAQCSFSGN